MAVNPGRCERCDGMVAEDYAHPGEFSCRSCGARTFPDIPEVETVPCQGQECEGSVQRTPGGWGARQTFCEPCLSEQRKAVYAQRNAGAREGKEDKGQSISTQCERCGQFFPFRVVFDQGSSGGFRKKHCSPCRRIVGGHGPEPEPSPEPGQLVMNL